MKGARPRVLVTFGTVFGSAQALSPLLRGVAPIDAEIVATLSGGTQTSDFDADVRDRVTFVSFVPLDELRAAAGRLAEEIAAMPAPAEVVEALDRLR